MIQKVEEIMHDITKAKIQKMQKRLIAMSIQDI